MRIVMVTNNALEDKMGGHERYVRELSSTLAARGHHVAIIAKRWSADQPAVERRPDGVEIQRVSVPSKRNPLFALLFPAYVMLGILKRTRADRSAVLHAHMAMQATPLLLSRLPYALTFHAPVWRELLSERQNSYRLPGPMQQPVVQLLRRVESVSARHAAVPIVLSEFMRSELAQLDASAALKARVIPGGVNLTRFFDDGIDRERDREITLFTARRLTPRTGVDELIKAVAIIAAKISGVRLKIAGTGPQEPTLRRLAAETGWSSAIDFLGRISDEELVNWYRKATVVVMPTRELEGFGLTTAEALACGAAVVGTPAGATPELLGQIDSGLIADDVSAEAIAAAILRVLTDDVRLRRARERSTAVVVPRMGWEEIADRHLEIYESIGPRG